MREVCEGNKGNMKGEVREIYEGKKVRELVEGSEGK